MSETLSSTSPKNPLTKWMAIVIAILSFALYSKSLKSDLVYDASVQITSDDYIHTRSNLLDVFTFHVMGRDVLDFNRPVHLQLLMIESLIWGREPFGYHLTSVLLHSINSMLVFLIILRLFHDLQRLKSINSSERFNLSAAFLGAMLFAALPACVEAIAEPSYREDPLATFFALIGLFLATKISDRTSRNRWLWVGIIFCCLYSIGAKEIGIATPFLIAAYFLLFRRGEKLTNFTVPIICGLLVCGIFTITRFALETKNSVIFGKGPGQFAPTLSAYFKQQSAIWRLYLEAFFWPFRLNADYTYNSTYWFSSTTTWIMLGGFLLFQILLSCCSRLALFATILFWLAILPISNIMPQFHPAADRYLYMPAICLGIYASVIFEWIGQLRILRGSVWVMVIALLIGCAKVTWERQDVFSSELALWEDVRKGDSDSFHASNGLGYYYLYKGDLKLAKKNLENARVRNGNLADPWCGLAVIALREDEAASANYYFSNCVKRDPDYADIDTALKHLKIDKRQAEIMKPVVELYQKQRTN